MMHALGSRQLLYQWWTTSKQDEPGMTRWKEEPLKCRGLPDLPTPFSPAWARHRLCGWEVHAPTDAVIIDGDVQASFWCQLQRAIGEADASPSIHTQYSPVHRARKFSAVCMHDRHRSREVSNGLRVFCWNGIRIKLDATPS